MSAKNTSRISLIQDFHPAWILYKNLKQTKLNKNTYNVVSKSGDLLEIVQLQNCKANSFLKFSKWKMFVL